jgi:hypothetical protein
MVGNQDFVLRPIDFLYESVSNLWAAMADRRADADLLGVSLVEPVRLNQLIWGELVTTDAWLMSQVERGSGGDAATIDWGFGYSRL